MCVCVFAGGGGGGGVEAEVLSASEKWSALKRSKFFPFIKTTAFQKKLNISHSKANTSHKSCLHWRKSRKICQVYPVYLKT